MFVWVVFSHPLAHLSPHFHVRLGVVGREWQAPLLRPLRPLATTRHILLFSGGKERLIIFDEGQRLPELTEIFFSDQSCFLSLDHSTTTDGSTTVCLVCAAGV